MIVTLLVVTWLPMIISTLILASRVRNLILNLIL